MKRRLTAARPSCGGRPLAAASPRLCHARGELEGRGLLARDGEPGAERRNVKLLGGVTGYAADPLNWSAHTRWTVPETAEAGACDILTGPRSPLAKGEESGHIGSGRRGDACRFPRAAAGATPTDG